MNKLTQSAARFGQWRLFLILISLCSSPMLHAQDQPYLNPKLNIDARVADLLGRMTLEEKFAQLQAVWIGRQHLENDSGEFIPNRAAEFLQYGIGHIARPSENKDIISTNKGPQETVKFVNDLQRWLLENTRLGIPALFHEEALHGHAAKYATSFPQAIALASTFDPERIKQMYAVTAAEVRARGGNQVLTPILDVARDPRWGRIEETMGEDPYLVAVLGVAAVQGFQGEVRGKIPPGKVIATLKHLTGHGEPSGGLNTAPAALGERALREVFLPPFEAAVKLGGAESIMPSYNEIDGIPSHANVKVLRDILRGEWGFDGTIVSDYFAISELMSRHHLTDNKADAALLALRAGVNVEMPDGDSFPALLQQKSKINLTWIDESVRRVLKDKFMLGLFEHPYTDPAGVEQFIGNAQHRALSQQIAEEAIVLLKNQNNILPLNKNKLKSIAVIGPYIDETLLGGYSDVPRSTVTILDGMRRYLQDSKVKLLHSEGIELTKIHWQTGADSRRAKSFSKERWHTDRVEWASTTENKQRIQKAVALARQADVALVVVGDNESTSREAWVESHLGDSTSLQLPGDQQALVDGVLASGTPVIVLLINGRPLAISEIADKAPAILEGWYLGQETGTAVARVLFGEVSPSGKLPVSIPRSVGHIPSYYNYKPTAKRGYAFTETTALYPFGHGLSYSQFEYSGLRIDAGKAAKTGHVKITMTLKNSGKLTAAEVVQLYIRDEYASVTRPVQELKGFEKVTLTKGKAVKISFLLPLSQLAFYDVAMNKIIEPGVFKVMIGSSSSDIRLTGEFKLTEAQVQTATTELAFTESSVSH